MCHKSASKVSGLTIYSTVHNLKVYRVDNVTSITHNSALYTCSALMRIVPLSLFFLFFLFAVALVTTGASVEVVVVDSVVVVGGISSERHAHPAHSQIGP